MKILKFVNERTKNFTYIDYKLTGLYGMLLGAILIKLVPSILKVNIWYFVGGAVLIAARLVYVFFKKVNKE